MTAEGTGSREPGDAGQQFSDMLSFVVPVYGAPEALEALCQRVRAVCAGMNTRYEIILVDDRCPRGSWAVIQRLARRDPAVRAIRLSRNFGQHAAIHAGLARVKGDWIVVMDCDLQDLPEEVPALLAHAREGNFDIVRARRVQRNDTWFRTAASKAFSMLLGFLTDTHQSAEIANFGVYRRKVIDVLNGWHETSQYFPAIIEWVGFSSSTAVVAHGQREKSTSSYNLRKLFGLAIDVVVGFSDRPLKILMASGLVLALTTFGVAFLIVLGHWYGFITIEGWAGLMLSLWFLAGCILFGLGMTGLYVGRILIEAKGRPTFIIDEEVNAPPSDPRE